MKENPKENARPAPISVSTLRVGSIVLVEDDVDRNLRPMTVAAIKSEFNRQVQFKGYNDWYDEDELIPIQLTEEVLEATELSYTDYYHVGYNIPYLSLCLVQYGDDEWRVFDNTPYGQSTPITGSIRYLHQLQDLYLVLTGKELEIDKSKLPYNN